MNSQMEQFFKVMLALVMTVILISTLAGYLKENYSSFDIQDETTRTTKNNAGCRRRAQHGKKKICKQIL